MAAEHPINDSPLTQAEFIALLEAAVDGICVIDDNGTIEQTNPAMGRLFGYAPGELDGQNVSLLMTGADRSAHAQYVASYVATGHASIIGKGREVVHPFAQAAGYRHGECRRVGDRLHLLFHRR